MTARCCKTLFCFAVALLVPATLLAGQDNTASLDQEIAFWEKRRDKDPNDAQTQLKLGAALLQKAREGGAFSCVQKAAAALEAALKVNPKNPEALNYLASAELQRFHLKEALALAEKASKLAPEDGFAYGLMGDAWIELGELDKAETNYVRSMELAPDVYALSRWANLQFLRGDPSAAAKFYKEALADAQNKARPPFDAAWCRLQLGQLLFRAGNFDAAEALYQEALKALPENYLPLDYLAELRGAQERFDDAIGLYQQAIALAPRPELYQALGDLLVLAQKPEQSAEMFKQASELYIRSVNEGDSLYFHHLAGFYSDSSKSPPEAVRWARRDADLRKSIYAHDCLAWALYQNGDFKEARDEMKKALSAGTLDAHLFNHAALIFFRAGDVAASRDALRKAAETNPQYNTFHEHRN